MRDIWGWAVSETYPAKRAKQELGKVKITDELTTIAGSFGTGEPPLPCRTTRGTDLVVSRQEGELSNNWVR